MAAALGGWSPLVGSAHSATEVQVIAIFLGTNCRYSQKQDCDGCYRNSRYHIAN